MARTLNSDRHRGGFWRIAGWGAAAALLATPLVAMQFTNEVRWDARDFIAFAAMLVAAGGLCELAVRASASLAYRIAAAIAVVAGFVLIWANLAVGIIGGEDEPANLLFLGVPVIGIAGALVARGRAGGMAGAMIAVATGQIAIGAYALLAGLELPFFFTAIYAMIWLGLAWLFATAARAEAA